MGTVPAGEGGRDRTTRLLLLAAVLLVTAGFVVGGITACRWWGRVESVRAAQDRLAGQWDAGTAARDTAAAAEARGRRPAAAAPFRGAAETPSDAPIARLYLPTLRLTFVVVEGAGQDRLMLGPGRIEGTAPLGEPGNTGIAAHRYPGIFWDLDELEVSDPVVVETRETWLVYRVIDASVVAPDHDEVLAAPVPGAGPLLTLVTCEPKLSTASRLIRQATLVRRDPLDGPRPAELA